MNRYPWRFSLAVLAWSAFLLVGAAAARAHAPQGTLQQSNAFPQVRGDWQEAMRLVNQIRAIATS